MMPLNQSDDIEKIRDLLHDGSYQQLGRDLTSRIKQEITSLLKSSNIPIETLKDLIPRKTVTPSFYRLPKIQKKPYGQYHWITNFVKCNARSIKPFICYSSSIHFVQVISDITLDPNDCLISFDVTPFSQKSQLMTPSRQLLSENGHSDILADLAEKLLSSTYFLFRNKNFQQTFDTPIGSPLSPALIFHFI